MVTELRKYFGRLFYLGEGLESDLQVRVCHDPSQLSDPQILSCSSMLSVLFIDLYYSDNQDTDIFM